MLGNAYQDGKQVAARIRASVHGAHAAGRLDGAPELPLREAHVAVDDVQPPLTDDRPLMIAGRRG